MIGEIKEFVVLRTLPVGHSNFVTQRLQVTQILQRDSIKFMMVKSVRGPGLEKCTVQLLFYKKKKKNLLKKISLF